VQCSIDERLAAPRTSSPHAASPRHHVGASRCGPYRPEGLLADAQLCGPSLLLSAAAGSVLQLRSAVCLSRLISAALESVPPRLAIEGFERDHALACPQLSEQCSRPADLLARRAVVRAGCCRSSCVSGAGRRLLARTRRLDVDALGLHACRGFSLERWMTPCSSTQR